MYVIYKENNLPGVGGIHPQGIEVGLAYYKKWNLAKCPDEKLHLFKEFDFVSVSTNIVNGLIILGSMFLEEDGRNNNDIDDIEDSDIDIMGVPMESSIINPDLSELDRLNMNDAKIFINNLELKTVTRAKVREMKDLEDDLVDLKRVVQSLITFVVDDWRVKSESDKDNSRFKVVLNSLDIAVAENIGALSTIENDLEKIASIVDTEVEIATLVDDYYLTRKL